MMIKIYCVISGLIRASVQLARMAVNGHKSRLQLDAEAQSNLSRRLANRDLEAINERISALEN